MNVMKTAVLLAAMTALFGVIGYLLGGPTGMLMALGFGLLTNLFAWWNSDKAVLSAHNAEEVDERSAPELVGMVRELAARANMPMPRVYIIHEDQPNAFATGRNPENSAVAATTGLLQQLSYEEVAGVMAHELAHIKNRDTLIMTITASIAGAISAVANFGLLFGGDRDRPNPIVMIALAVLAPLAAGIIQMAISRSREFEADRVGAEICGRPDWLASALSRIAGGASMIPNMGAERNPATAHMFIINPLDGRAFDGLFSTHPPTEQRIAALMDLQRQWVAASMPAQGRAAARHVPPRPGPFRGPWG